MSAPDTTLGTHCKAASGIASAKSSKLSTSENPQNSRQAAYKGKPWSLPLCKFILAKSKPIPFCNAKSFSLISSTIILSKLPFFAGFASKPLIKGSNPHTVGRDVPNSYFQSRDQKTRLFVPEFQYFTCFCVHCPWNGNDLFCLSFVPEFYTQVQKDVSFGP